MSNDTYSLSQAVGISMGVGCWVLGVGGWGLGCDVSAQPLTPVSQPLKLPEKPEIVFEQQADIVDAVPEHGHSIEAETEGVAGPFFRVQTNAPEDIGMDH